MCVFKRSHGLPMVWYCGVHYQPMHVTIQRAGEWVHKPPGRAGLVLIGKPFCGLVAFFELLLRTLKVSKPPFKAISILWMKKKENRAQTAQNTYFNRYDNVYHQNHY